MSLPEIEALTFDVFGTVVDWRTSVAREARALLAAKGYEYDWGAFADAWRARYQPAMEQVRAGKRPWVKLDELHYENLLDLIGELGISGLSEAELTHLNHAWHRLDPWPDSVEGLARLRRHFVVATMSNGNISLMVQLSRAAGLEWDCILGAEVARSYKPLPEVYLRSADALDIPPGRCLMVAAHRDDLLAAKACGFRTAFIERPQEFGERPWAAPSAESAADSVFDLNATSLNDLAQQLAC
jgi:2-haloacid dehalogenase